jgi:hypothetical protein
VPISLWYPSHTPITFKSWAKRPIGTFKPISSDRRQAEISKMRTSGEIPISMQSGIKLHDAIYGRLFDLSDIYDINTKLDKALQL